MHIHIYVYIHTPYIHPCNGTKLLSPPFPLSTPKLQPGRMVKRCGRSKVRVRGPSPWAAGILGV